jgi:phage terminase large subunit-like protein
MGLRGPRAEPKQGVGVAQKSKPTGFDIKRVQMMRTNPWERKGLTRPERVIAFCEDLMVTSGELAGQKLKLRMWQKKFIRGIYTQAEGKRRVRTAILSMARKNGKTQLAAALALCHLCGPESEMRGEVYACANDRFQASKIFHEMVAMIERHPWLSVRTNIGRFRKDIEDLVNGSLYATLTAEAKTKMGLSPSFVVYDELGQATDRELYDAMDSAMGARKNPMMLVISTQAANSAAPLSHLIDYGLKVEAGEITDNSFHLTLYTAPDDMDPYSKQAWDRANPALDDFRSLEDVQRLARQAQRIPSQENAFRNLILNQRTAAEARFMDASAWKACGGEPAVIPPGRPVFAGLDLGSTRDLSAFVIAWQNPMNGKCHVKCWCWVPGNLQARGDQDGAPYEVWARKGIVIPAGKATDPRAIVQTIGEVNMLHPIQGLAFDRWRMAEIKRELESAGLSRIPLIEHGQGYKDMSPAVDCVERLVSTGKLIHGDNPVLTWAANNAVVLRDPTGSRKFDKSQTAYRARIDPLVALAMALSAMLVKESTKPFVFDVEALIGNLLLVALPSAVAVNVMNALMG